MGAKNIALQAIADAVIDFVNLEIPGVGKWNQGRDAIQSAFPTIGQWLDDVDALVATLTAKFDADHDPTTGLNPAPAEWTEEASPPTFLDGSRFALAGDRRADYRTAQRLRATIDTGFVIAAVVSLTYNAGLDRTEFVLEAPVLNATLSAVWRPLLFESLPKIRAIDLMPASVGSLALAAASVIAGKLAANAVLEPNHATGNVSNRALAAQAVTIAKLAIGASLNNAGADTDSSALATGVLQDVLTLPPFTVRGGRVLLLVDGQAELEAGERVRVRIKRDSNILRSMQVGQTNTPALYTSEFSLHAIDLPLAPGPYTYAVDVLATGAGNVSLSDLTFSAVEFA